MRLEELSVDERSSLLLGEMLLFDMLGRMLHTNPSRAWLEPLIADALFDSVPFGEDQEDTIQGLALLARWAASASDRLSDSELRELRADFAQLFIGNHPMRVPPWESVYFSEERLTFQQETLAVRGWYERLGFQINARGNDPEDHIAFELSFVARCAERALQARKDQNEIAFADAQRAQRAFLENHLLRWGCKWAELALTHARTDFYRGLALLTRGGLKELACVCNVELLDNIHYPGIPSL